MIYFASNTYNTLAIRGQDDVRIDEPLSFQETNKFVEESREEFKFSFVDITFDNFTKTYQSPNQSAWAVVASKIYALTRVIFGTPFVPLLLIYEVLAGAVTWIQTGNGDKGLAHLSRFARVGQELIGHLAKIFYEPLGSYLIQEAQFHAMCYEAYLNPEEQLIHGMHLDPLTPLRNLFGLEELRKQVNKECLDITFADLKNGDEDFKKKYLTFYLANYELGLMCFNAQLSAIEQSEANDNQVTELLNIGDFFFPENESNFTWARLSDERLATTDLLNIRQAGPHQVRFINQRLNLIEEIYQKPERGNEYLCIQDIRQLNLEENLYLHDLPDIAFALLSDEQLATLRLDNLSAKQVEYIFYRHDTGYGIDAEGCKATFDLLSANNDLQQNHDKFPAHLLQYNLSSSVKRCRATHRSARE